MTIEYKDSKRIIGLQEDRIGATASQGNNGGAGQGGDTTNTGGGGGGGAGAAGATASGNAGGDGGIGLQSDIWQGTNDYYAGGGGGGTWANLSGDPDGGTGGTGGGGNGGEHYDNPSTATAGDPNTGGGGGAAGITDGTTKAGGSGVVILQFTTSGTTFTTTGSPESDTSVSGKTTLKYTNDGTFTIQSGSPDVRYLVVGGGGGGAGGAGGGGGAGGFLTGTKSSLAIGTYTVTVGAGGAGYSSSTGTQLASNGENSSFAGVVASGGGGGANNNSSAPAGADGGSGGGGGGRHGGAGGSTVDGTTVSVTIPTNVQDNSLLVEKDTARRYWFTASSDFDFSASSSGAVSNQPTDATEVGQLITSTTHRGKKAKSATFYVKKVGSPSGTMVYKIRKTSDNSVVATSTGTSASALSTSTTAVTLNFNDEVIPSENIRVTVSGVTGSSGNLVTIYGGGADTVADQSLSVWGGSSWTEYGNDCAGKLTFTESWTMQPTKQFDFSSSTGWVPVGSNITVTGGAITASAMVTQGSANRIYYDLGSALSDKFVIDFDHYADTASAGGFWGMFALTDTTAIPRTDDAIYPLIDMGSWTTYLRYVNEGTETNVGSLGNLTTGQWQYVRFVRDDTTGTLTVYSDSARTTQVLNVSGTIPATVTGLRYFQSGSLSGANSGTATYKIDNLKIYDGVTSIN